MPARIASDKYLYWREVMARFQESGLTGTQFCRQEDLKYTAFADWRQRLKKQEPRKSSKCQQVNDWEAVIKNARANPGGVQQYCEEHSICKKTFYKRFKELKHAHPDWGPLVQNSGRKRSAKPAKETPTKAKIGNAILEESFAPVQIVEDTTERHSAIDVILQNSITLRIVPGCSIEFLQTIASALGGA